MTKLDKITMKMKKPRKQVVIYLDDADITLSDDEGINIEKE